MKAFEETIKTSKEPVPHSPSKSWPWFVPPLIYLLLAIVLTWPLLPNFLSAIPRGLPDSYQNMWNFWWVRTALFERHANPYYTDLLYYPYRNAQNPLPLYVHTLQPALSLVAGLFSTIIGYIAAYNLVVIFGYVATGWATYVLARYFIRNEWAAFAAGLLYTFAPFHQYNLALGQVNVFWLQFIPLYILLLHKALEKGTRPYLWIILAVLCFWLCFLVDWYYFLYLGLYSVVYLLVRVALTLRKDYDKAKNYDWRQLILRTGAIGLATLVLASPILWGVLRTSQDAAIISQDSLDENISQSASLSALFLRPDNFGAAAQGYYLAYVGLVLAIVGLWAVRRLRLGWWWIGIGLVTFALSLGPYLQIALPDGTGPHIVENFPMPYRLFHKLPLIGYSRSPYRMLSLTTLALSLLAGWGVAWLGEKLSLLGKSFSGGKFAKQAGVSLILLIFLLEVQGTPLNLDSLYYPKFFDEIARDPDKSYGLVELPITTHYTRDSRRMFYQSIHHHPITSGYISRRVIQFYDDNEPLGHFFGRFPFDPDPIFRDNSQVQLKTLQLYSKINNLRYIVHYRDDYEKDQAGAAQFEKYLQTTLGSSTKAFDDGRTSVYRIPTDPAPPPVVLVSTNNGYKPEKLPDGRNYRWARQQLEVQLLADRDIEIQLGFMAWSLPDNNKLEVRLDGNPTQILALAQSPQNQTVKLKLKAGRNLVQFASTQSGSFPQDLGLPYTDTRKLAFAFGDVQLDITNK